MGYEIIIFPLLTGMAVLMLAWAGFSFIEARRPEKRVKHRVEVAQVGNAGQVPSSGLGPFAGLLSFFGSKLGPTDVHVSSECRLRLCRAGYSSNWAPGAFWGIRILLALLFGIGGLMLRFAIPEKVLPMYLPFVALTCAYVGFMIPAFWISYRTRSRKTKLIHELPEALDLMVVCVESGMGLDQTLSRVAKDLRLSCPELSKELHQVGLELLAGQGRAEVLRSLAKRTGVEELDSLVTLVVQSEQLGTSIARTLRIYSDTLRVKRFQAAEEIAGKLPVKLMVPLIFFVMPILFVVLMGPASIRIMGIFAR